MSVLINMEMPKSCKDCELAKHFDGYQENDCPFNAFSYYDCPLVELPPHGRLIDADELAEDLDFDVENDLRALDSLDIVGKEREHIQFDKDCKQNCIYYLSNCPTIVPAERKED